MPKPKSKKAVRSAVTVKAGRSNRAGKTATVNTAVAAASVQPLTDELYVAQLFAAAEALPPVQKDAVASSPVNIVVETHRHESASDTSAAAVASAQDSMIDEIMAQANLPQEAHIEEEVLACEAPAAVDDVPAAVLDEQPSATQIAAEPVALSSESEAMAAALPVAEPVTAVEPELPMSATDSAASSEAALSLSLPAQCLMRDAVDLRQQLLPLLEESRAVTLDVSVVERIDTAVMQVLLTFTRERALKQLPVEWHGCTAFFADAARTLGLHALMNIPAVEAA